jgi:tetratricopeptide (TPR) repeat protein
MYRPLALAAILLVSTSVSADDKDWTGKTIKLKFDNLKLGSKFGGGLLRDGVALDQSKTYVVKADDGSYLELVGQTGFIFKIEAEVVAGAPAARPDAPAPKPDAPAPKPDTPVVKADGKSVWAADTKVLPKRRANQVPFGDRDAAGHEMFFEMSGIMPMVVRKDRGDGWVRIHDGHREGWARKDDLVTREDAPAYWDRTLKANPTDTWALYMRGNGWWQQGDPDRAIKDFDECIRLDPRDRQAFNSRGNAWRDKKEYDKAIGDFTEAIKINPFFAIAFHNRGNARRDKKEYDRAINDFTEALRLDPRYVPAYINRGLTWVDKKEYANAIADYTEAARLDPKDVPAYYNRGDARLARKEYDKAIADYDRALELDPKCVSALADKALALSKLKKFDAAVSGFEAALKLDPPARLYREYGLFLAACPDAKYRDGKKAVELAKKAVEKAGRDADWEYAAALAAALAEAGEFELAVAEQKKAVDDTSIDKDARKTMEDRLDLYRAGKPYRAEG